ncbi:ShlB/FhaC/HecB family hemolysin secretion/activation protein [Ramlibacter tataouinensis]|uniref:ShlB/FhaC/HecB family hemolysin secretion/activation protein n=1 Tax=Ramlibacter tataouinensis TaxID=94132 RepID=UPI0022F405A8|nr:ShlB/FhaC/HecB family hemolysin secretion/activation protein [Ramlibacter tataouinensis]WBY03415.1 ShlB/FhaC/HecB family hemolysin secretion/activation protein [Ramlibacter tataouinensis]
MFKRNGAPAHGQRRRVAPAVLALALSAVAGAAWGQAPAAPLAPAPEPVFAIQGFQVTGDNPLGPAETGRILAPFVRADATMGSLQQATGALEAALRARGYGLHRVSLPPQEVGATVRLEIVTFSVHKVAVEGAQIHGAGNVRRALPELQEGRTPNFKRLAVQTAIANENPNRQVQVGIREGDEPDRIDATVTVKESRPWTFAVNASNTGSDSTGRDRLTVSGGHTNLFDRDHQFTGAYTTSLERLSDVQQVGLAYRVPLYALGGVVGASYTRSDVVGNFGAFTSTGAGHTFGLNYTWYLPPEGGRRSYLVLGLEDKVFKAARINDIVVPGALDRRSRPLVLGYNARTETDAAVWGYDAYLAVNTGSGRANDLASYQSEDPRVATTRWKALRGTLHYAAPFAGSWLLSARAQYQYSPDVLISGEQFGLGGSGSVRGTAIERPLSGDKGLAGSVELSTPELGPGLRLFGFADAGWLWNNSPNGTTKPASDRLGSIGLGARYTRGPLVASVEYGRLVAGSRVPLALNASSPQNGDDKLYVNIGVRF